MESLRQYIRAYVLEGDEDKFTLRLRAEYETEEELYDNIVPVESYMMKESMRTGKVIPFRLNKQFWFGSLQLQMSFGRFQLYRAYGCAVEHYRTGLIQIYRSQEGKIIIVVDDWFADQISKIVLGLMTANAEYAFAKFCNVDFQK